METPCPNIAQRTVGDIVADDYRLGAVFKRFGIDFCCGGGRTVQAACDKQGVAYDELEQALLAAQQSRTNGAPDVRAWEPGFLADYIVNVHHNYVRESLPVLIQFAQKVARVHGGNRPELVEIAKLVTEIAAELDEHTQKEEDILFPYIKELSSAQQNEAPAGQPAFGTVQNPIRVMEHEHDHAGALMRRIRTLSDDFTPPAEACNTYRALFAKLEEFEEDLHRHVHLENNILFPAALTLEQAVSQN